MAGELALALLLAACVALLGVALLRLRSLVRLRDRAATDRARLTDERARARRQLDAVIASGDAVIAFDVERLVRVVSASAARLLGVDAGAVAGWSDVTLLRDHELHEALVRAMQSGRAPAQRLEIERAGRTIAVEIVPLSDAAGWAALLFLRDVSELRRLETMRRDFVSNVSHEFRTPLASIKAVLESLEAGALEDRELARDFVERAEDEVNRLTQLVEELTELGRIESGAVPFHFEPVDTRELIDDCARRLRAQAERAGIELRVEPGPAPPLIRADRERLGRALLNLVHNALKFTPAGGTVSLRAAAVDGYVELAVQDTGAGIPAAELSRIFERFYKADRSRGGSGTGLGLAIVKHTVEVHGGTVAVHSTVGLGSTFTIRIPARGSPSG